MKYQKNAGNMCSYPAGGCSRKAKCKGLCLGHYNRLRATGSLGSSDFNSSTSRVIVDGKALCRKCEEWKDFQQFRLQGETVFSYCRSCVNHMQRSRRDPERDRAHRLFKMYGISVDEYDIMLETQEFGCKICGRSDPRSRGDVFVVDHDHNCCSGKKSCGKCIRGLLCSPCNTALGCFYEKVEVMKEAINYMTYGAVGDQSEE